MAAVRASASRRGTHLLAVVVAALLAAVVGVVPSAAPRSAVTSRCVPTGSMATVEDLNRFVARTPVLPAFLGADVGVDVDLGDGRSAWFFADTLLAPARDGRLVRNSMLVLDGHCAFTVVGAGGAAVVPDRSDGVGYWPMSAWRGDGSLFVMLQRVTDAPGAGFAVLTLGPALATFRVPDVGAPRLVRVVDLGADDPSPASPEWGAASALDGGWLYLYGTSTRELPGAHGFALRVARVHPDQVADPSTWTYWDGARWTPDARAAAPLITEQGGVSQTLSVWPADGRWYVLSKRDEFLGRDIVVWTGDSPEGPFDGGHVVAPLPCDERTGELRYMPLAHPGLLPQPGTVVVSYSRNFLDLTQVCAVPTRYRPRFIRVQLPD